MSDQPLSGAQFARQVGTDPEKWAEAFDKEAGRISAETGGHWPHNREERIGFLAKWFADAMEAAVKAAVSPEDWEAGKELLAAHRRKASD